MVCLTKRATPRIATDNKPSWTSATLHVSRRQFIRRKTTFPVPVLADLVNKDTCLTDFFFFFQIRSWRLDGMTARKHYTHHYCNWTTHKCSLPQKKDRKRKKKYYSVLSPSLLFQNYREDSGILTDIIFAKQWEYETHTYDTDTMLGMSYFFFNF